MRWRIRGTPSESGVRRIIRERENRVVMPLPVASGEVLVSATNTIGNFTTTVKTTTGYVRAQFWDATDQVFGTGNPSSFLTVTKSLVGAPAGKKPTTIMSSNAIGGKGGLVTALQFPTNITEVDMRAIDHSLAEVVVNSTNTSVLFPEDPVTSDIVTINNGSWFRLDAITYKYLTVRNTDAREIDCGWPTAARGIEISNHAAVTTANLLGVKFEPAVFSNIYISLNSALTTVLCKNTAATEVTIAGNPLLTTLDLGELVNAERINLQGNNLTSVSLKDSRPTGGKSNSTYVTPALDLRLNQLSATALNDVFADLANVGGSPVGLPIIHVAQNPGAATCTPSIATAKGYVVLTT